MDFLQKYENESEKQKQNYENESESEKQKIWNASRICVSSLRRGHANLLCIVPILVYVVPKQLHQWLVRMLYLYSWFSKAQNAVG